jgi:hypothetical protein
VVAKVGDKKKRTPEGLDGLPFVDMPTADWAFPMFGIVAALLLSLVVWGSNDLDPSSFQAPAPSATTPPITPQPK